MRQLWMARETQDLTPVRVLPTDTLLAVLGLMQRTGLRVVPVVADEGELLGLVTEAHVLGAWDRGPLVAVEEVMAACAVGAHPDEELEPRAYWRADDVLAGASPRRAMSG